MIGARRGVVSFIGIGLAAAIVAGCRAPGDRVGVPDVVGWELDFAFVSVRDAGLLVTVEGRYGFASNLGQATVVRQDPEAGTEVEVGTSVTLVARAGPIGRPLPNFQSIIVPDVTAVSLATASERLARAQLMWFAGRSPPLRNSDAPDLLAAYCVASQAPAPGSRFRQATRSEGGARLHFKPIVLSIEPAPRDGPCP
jgi:beta-lactam-binding protein with PASTA domain